MDVPSPLQISRSQSCSKSGENVALVSYLRAEPPCTPPKKATGWVKGTPSTNRPPTNPTYHKFLAQSDSITTHIIYPSDSLSQPHSNDFSFYLQDKQAHFSVILDAHGRNRHKYIHIHPDTAQISVRLASIHLSYIHKNQIRCGPFLILEFHFSARVTGVKWYACVSGRETKSAFVRFWTR